MIHELGFSQLLLIGDIILVVASATTYLAIGAVVLMVGAGMFPGDPLAGLFGKLAASLMTPLLLFWILWTAIKMIIGFKPRRHRGRCQHD